MKELPILFSTKMVQAILAGRKTQTRRIVKFRDDFDGKDVYNNAPFGLKYSKEDGTVWRQTHPWINPDSDHCLDTMLWVKETYLILEPEHCEGMNSRFYYRAGHHSANEEWRLECIRDGYPYKWHPSIFMKKIVARIWLKVEDVGVQRLKQISEEDAIAEGVGSGFQMNAGWPDYTMIKNGVCELTQDTARMSYATLWDSINGKGAWDVNPFVWVLKYKVLSTKGKV